MAPGMTYLNPKSYVESKPYLKEQVDEDQKKKEALVPIQGRKRSNDEEYINTHLRVNDTKYIPKLINPLLSNERFHEMNGSQLSSMKDDGTSLPTCHLCGKAVCGQRMGRIQCSTCNKIFCLQQLQRKFDMIVDINDTSFRCPRCLGFCCCVCDCRRPPPHVHCKVFKVRENKRKRLENIESTTRTAPPSMPIPKQDTSSMYYQSSTMSQIPLSASMKSMTPLSPLTSTPIGLIPRNSSITSMTTLDLAMQPLKGEDPIQSRLCQNPNDNMPIIMPPDPWNQNCNIWQPTNHMNSTQNQGIDWLTALNDSLLVPSSPTTAYNQSSTMNSMNPVNSIHTVQNPSMYNPNGSSTSVNSINNQQNRNTTQLTDKLKYLFENFQKMNSSQIEQEKNDILYIADTMQNKSAKCDVLLRLVESFNKHAINAKITWIFQESGIEDNNNYKPIPAFYTILKYYPNILFSIESSSFFCEREEAPDAPTSLSVTFINTSSHRDQRGVATVVALIDNSLRRNYNVTFTEEWVSDPTMSWKNIGQIDQRKLRQMLAFAEEAQQKLESSKEKSRVWLRIRKQGTSENYLEKIPLLALLLKRLCADYSNLVFSLDKVNINGEYLQIIIVFNEKHDWANTIPRYEKGIEVLNPDENSVQLQKIWSTTKLFSM